MADTSSGGRTRYQVRGDNTIRRFGIIRSNSYRKVWGHGFNSTKPKVRRIFEALGSNLYSIEYPQKADKYTKTTEAILNHIKGSINEGNDAEEALEEINNYNFNVIKPKTPGKIPEKGSYKEIILREEVKNWFMRKTKYNTKCIRHMRWFWYSARKD